MFDRTFYAALIIILAIILNACGGGTNAEGNNTGGGNTGGGNTGGATTPLQTNLTQATTWTFVWNKTTLNFAQGSGTSASTDSGEFTITLGAAVTIAGESVYPLNISGATGDFLPRWTHIAVSSDGSLIGSNNGSSLETIYNAATDSWLGGGFFIEFDETEAVNFSTGSFIGEYNTVNALIAGHGFSDGGCESILGNTICNDTTTQFSENEFYKAGIGPIGFQQHIFFSSSGGGFFTSNTIDKTVELVGTSLMATDNTVFNPPPWQRMASMNTARSGHSAVVYNGEIYAIGGFNSNGSLNSVEIYDANTNQWRAGPPVPVTQSLGAAAVVDGIIYVDIFGANDLQAYNGSAWSTVTPVQGFDGSLGSTNAATYSHSVLGPIIIGVTGGSAISRLVEPVGYDPSPLNQWISAPTLTVNEWLRPAVTVIGDQLYIIGGFGSFASRGALSIVMRHGLEDEQWTTSGITGMGTARDNLAVVTMNDRIYAFGGNAVSCGFSGCNIGAEFRSAEVYDPVANIWSPITSMFTARKSAAAVALNGDIYVIGGRGGSYLDSVERFTPP